MPIEIVQSNSGGTTGSGNATLGAGTTVGNTVVIVQGAASTLSTPAGFTRRSETPGGSAPSAIYSKAAVGAETSWAIVVGAGIPLAWAVYELAGDVQVDVVPTGAQPSTTGTSLSTDAGTMPQSTTYDGWVLAAHSAAITTSTVPPTWSGHTNSFVELVDQGQSGATNAVGLSVSAKNVQALGAYSVTATASVSTTLGACIVVFSVAGARRAANVLHFWAFLMEGQTGLNLGPTTRRYWETQAGSPAITADGLVLASTAAAENVVTAGMTVTGTVKTVSRRIRLRIDGSLPGADVELANILPAAASTTTITYRTASQRLGVKIGTGTEQLSAATVAANTFIDLDLELAGTTTAFVCNWRMDGVVQTAATFTAAAAITAVSLQLGWTAAATASITVAYDVTSIGAGQHPLGDWSFVRLGVDPAGTVTLSGTAANFKVFTSNGGTMGAWDATAAKAAVDEWPPTVGASADGIAQSVLAGIEYVQIPMETHQAAPDGVLRAVKMVAPLWAASTAVNDLEFRIWDGAAEIALGVIDPGADNTAPPNWWVQLVKPTGGWTQPKLDAACVRFGFSGDATPAVGLHAVYFEVAVQLTATEAVFGEAGGGDIEVVADVDPVSGGIIALEATTPAERGTDLTYEEAGSPTTINLDPSDAATEIIEAPDAPTVNRVELHPDPEPEP